MKQKKMAVELLEMIEQKKLKKIVLQIQKIEEKIRAEMISKQKIEEYIITYEQEKVLSLKNGADTFTILNYHHFLDKLKAMLDRILQGANTKGLDTLRWMEPKAISELIKNEHPQIQTIILSYLDPDQSAAVLDIFDEKVRLDLVMRISNQESIQPGALQELNDIIEKQFLGAGSTQTKTVGGVKRAAEIMNFIDSVAQSTIMDGIKEKDPDLSQTIQDLMFVFDNLADLDDKAIQKLLREVSTDQLILALKGADAMMREKIFKNMSKRASELLKDDLEAKGPVKISDVEAAQKEILAIARKLSEAGEIALGSGGEQMI